MLKLGKNCLVRREVLLKEGSLVSLRKVMLATRKAEKNKIFFNQVVVCLFVLTKMRA